MIGSVNVDPYVLDWMGKHLSGCFWTDLSTGLTSLSGKHCSCAWDRCLLFQFCFLALFVMFRGGLCFRCSFCSSG